MMMATRKVLAVAVALALVSMAVPAQGASYCVRYEVRSYSCNCHQCNCQVCHSCQCHMNKVPWTDCDFDSCGNSGCWCSPLCNCCYDADCREQCNCETCCETCTENACAKSTTYEVHAIEPAAVPAAAPGPITVIGGFFVNTHTIRCRFGNATVNGTLLTNNAIQCTPPAVVLAGGTTAQVNVSVSLDDGQQWTAGGAKLSYYQCLDNCSGNGTCTERGVCECNTGYTGASCAEACPMSGGKVCAGHGTCSPDGGCDCDLGFWGTSCDQDCPKGLSDATCSGPTRGICSQTTGRCVCVPGYIGDACEHVGSCTQGGTNCTCSETGYWGTGCSKVCPGSSDCNPGTGCSTTCSDHGLCGHNGTCLCKPGFYGSACETACPSGNALPCSGHSPTGTCHEDGMCSCTTGYFGAGCELECPGGAATPCNNNGTCTVAGTCMCNAGYTGDACSLVCPRNAGDNSICSGKGKCLNDGTCQCDASYYGQDCSRDCSASACNNHGSCDETGKCVCNVGYYGTACANACPGGAANPCSQHGACDTSSGECHCQPGYFGADCSQSCPRSAAGDVCSNHGTCNTTSATCTCNSPYTGTSCETVFCPYQCYGHGNCAGNGTCICNHGWEGLYCSTQSAQQQQGIASFSFNPSFYPVSEDTGTMFVNVSRGGSTAGSVFVTVATRDVSAHASQDYIATSSKLVWKSGEPSIKSVPVIIIGDDNPEGIEIFEVVFSNPSPGSSIGDAAQVRISANDNAGITHLSVFISVVIDKPQEQLDLSTTAGAQFAAQFAADLAAAGVLGCAVERIIVETVESHTATSSLVTFLILDSTATGDARADALARKFVELMSDLNSALYTGTASQYLDISYEPVLRFEEQPVTPESTSYAWIAGVVIPIVILAVCGIVAYRKRRQLTEWLLWRLARFRFHTMLQNRAEKLEDMDDEELDNARL